MRTWRLVTISMALGRSLTLVRMHRSISSRISSVHSSPTLHCRNALSSTCFNDSRICKSCKGNHR